MLGNRVQRTGLLMLGMNPVLYVETVATEGDTGGLGPMPFYTLRALVDGITFRLHQACKPRVSSGSLAHLTSVGLGCNIHCDNPCAPHCARNADSPCTNHIAAPTAERSAFAPLPSLVHSSPQVAPEALLQPLDKMLEMLGNRCYFHH
jgi:hypothetical protein